MSNFRKVPNIRERHRIQLLPAKTSRLSYIDWMRGLACLLMFQTHCYDAWLSPEARKSTFFMYSQLGGTLPAPLFLFLAGISFALVTNKLLEKGLAPTQLAKITIRRGAEIFALGLLFRLQEYFVAWGWAPWSDLFRVDILNTIGMSMMLMGVLCWSVLALRAASNSTQQLPIAAGGTAMAIALLTPPLWTTWRPDWLPWPIESYVNGVHNLGAPQAWLFPIFPWSAFAFAGLTVGFVFQTGWPKLHEGAAFAWTGVTGLAFILVARWLDARPGQLYSTYDYWHTSPNFFLLRVGMLLMILSACYAWCRWGTAQWGFSPLIQLGQTSLLVYWVHIELVYGRISILPKRSENIVGASIGLLIITMMMLSLSIARTALKGKAGRLWKLARGTAPAA